VMIYAIQGGLSAEEILGRTRGSLGWGFFYGIFAIAVAIHGAIGLRAIAFEWAGIKGRALTGLSWGTFLLLSIMGLNAVWAVTVGGAP
ncbi:MAG: succinate dehydrogenase, partial [Pseudomonadota bacterium]